MLAARSLAARCRFAGTRWVSKNCRRTASISDGMSFFRAALERQVITVPGEFFDVDPGKRRGGRPSRFRRHLRFSFGPAMPKLELALERWRKLIWNIPFNGLSILGGGIDTAAIIGNKDLRQATLALMDEVIAAAQKCGHPLPSDAWREHVKRTETMGAYKPSTLQDWEAGRPLEIEPIWGEPLRRAVAAGGQMPRTEMIYAVLKKLDHNRAGAKNLTGITGQVQTSQ